MATESTTDFTLDSAAALAAEEQGAIEGKSPWLLAWRRLRRNYVALGFLALFVVIVVLCALAGPYAEHVAKTGPNENHLGETFTRDGKQVQIVSKGGFVERRVRRRRDPRRAAVVARGRPATSSVPTRRAATSPCVCSTAGGTRSRSGSARRSSARSSPSCSRCSPATTAARRDWVISRFFDLIWAFPVLLLAIALGTALSINGFHHFGINIESGSLWIPTLVISFVLIPYVGRPMRGQILSLREKEFIEAANSQGASSFRVMFSELLPNIASSVLVFFTLIIASNILTEAGLSFLGAGVQPPNPSWGTLIADGQTRIATAPWLAIIPGIAIVLTVLSLNVFGDGLRDALDPRAKVRIEH